MREGRIVFDVGVRLPRHTLHLAADLARALGLSMVGISSEDRALWELARVAVLRELRLPGHQWQSLDAQQLIHETELLAEQTKRLIAEEATARGLGCAFNGDSNALTDSDVVVITKPMWEASTGPLRFEKTSSAIMVVPDFALATSKSIAVMAQGQDDIAALLGMRIVEVTGDDLVMVRPPTEMSVAGLIRVLEGQFGVRRERLVILPPNEKARQIAGALADRRNSAVLVPTSATVSRQPKRSRRDKR